METSNRKNAGRKPGSFSFMKVNLEQLNKVANGQNIPCIVSRKWAESFGLQGTNAPANEILASTVGLTPATAVPVQVTEPQGN